MKPARPKPVTLSGGPADEAAAELRELIREAHGATRDLARVLRECRELRAELANQARDAAAAAANAEIERFSRHLQNEMNRHAADLNAGVARAQNHIIKTLTLARAEPDPGGGLRFIFDGAPFDADVPLP